MTEKKLYRLTDEEYEKLRVAVQIEPHHVYTLWCQVAVRVNCDVKTIKEDKVGDGWFFWAVPA